MAWLIRELKRFVKWMAILVGGMFVLVLGLAMMAPRMEKMQRQQQEDARLKQQEQADGWKKWFEEQKAKNEQQQAKKEPPAPGWENGFKAGYMTGFAAAAGGAVKPSSAQIDALARGQATKENVPEGERTAWKMGFNTGWTFGWSKGK